MQNDTIGACEAVGISENGNLGAGTITPVFSDSDPLSELLQMAEDARRWRQLREKLDQHRRIEFHIGKVIVPELKDDVWGAARRDGYYGAFGQTLGGGGVS